MRDLPYANLPPAPQRADAATTLARLVDAIGFRYRWVSEDLRPVDWAFRPSPESMSIRALSVHLLHLQRWCAREFSLRLSDGVPVSDSALRAAILDTSWALRERLLHREGPSVLDQRWHLIHGPLADALTHIGQIASWRRLSGNPMPPMSWPRGVRRQA